MEHLMDYSAVKVAHIVLAVGWFSGLLYLPHLLTNLLSVAPESTAERERLVLMSNKLLRVMMPSMATVTVSNRVVARTIQRRSIVSATSPTTGVSKKSGTNCAAPITD